MSKAESMIYDLNQDSAQTEMVYCQLLGQKSRWEPRQSQANRDFEPSYLKGVLTTTIELNSDSNDHPVLLNSSSGFLKVRL